MIAIRRKGGGRGKGGGAFLKVGIVHVIDVEFKDGVGPVG